MVHGCTRQRGRATLSGFLCRCRVSIEGVGDPVCRLCGVAARVVARGCVGPANGLLAEAVGGSGRGVGVTRRPSAPGGAEFPRRGSTVPPFSTFDRRIEGVEPARGRDAFYDVVSGIQGIALSVYGAG